jgi:hypothetical protein
MESSKLRSDLTESENRLKYIEATLLYFEKQAWEERNKIKKIYEQLKINYILTCLFCSRPSDYLINEVSDSPLLPDHRSYICISCCNEITRYRWHTDKFNFDLCDECYNALCILNS